MNVIHRAFQAQLEAAGFVRKASTWYFDASDAVLVVKLQRSQWGAQYYVNCAVAVRGLGTEGRPKEEHCHIRARLDDLLSQDVRPRFQAACDMDRAEFEDEARTSILQACLAGGLDLLTECRTREGIRRALLAGRFECAMVHRRVKEMVSS